MANKIFISMQNFKKVMNWVLRESSEPEDDLLMEPDCFDEIEQQEVSGATAVAGATTPLGTDATFPDTRVGKRKSAAEAAGDSFGRARPFQDNK